MRAAPLASRGAPAPPPAWLRSSPACRAPGHPRSSLTRATSWTAAELTAAPRSSRRLPGAMDAPPPPEPAPLAMDALPALLPFLLATATPSPSSLVVAGFVRLRPSPDGWPGPSAPPVAAVAASTSSPDPPAARLDSFGRRDGNGREGREGPSPATTAEAPRAAGEGRLVGSRAEDASVRASSWRPSASSAQARQRSTCGGAGSAARPGTRGSTPGRRPHGRRGGVGGGRRRSCWERGGAASWWPWPSRRPQLGAWDAQEEMDETGVVKQRRRLLPTVTECYLQGTVQYFDGISRG